MKLSKRWFAILAALAVVLLFLTAVLASRVVSQRVRHAVRLEPATVKSLAGLHGQVLLTYFESGRGAMPSSMKDVGEEVEALLAAMKAAAPDHVDVRVLDPDADPIGAAYASRHGASPVRVRRVVGDESSEAAVWSTLSINWERHPDGLIQGIMPGDLPHLEALIVETLASAETPRHPTIAIAAPARGYDQLRAQAGGLIEGRVVPVGSDHDLKIPPEADLLLWIQPGNPTRADAATLERFLASGRSVILAGSSCLLEPVRAEGAAHRWHPRRASHEWHDLLRTFGIEQDGMLLLDEHHAPIAWHVGDATLETDARFQLRILPSCLDTRTLLGPNSGVLVVSSVGALRWDPAALAASDRRAIVLATSSESSSATDVPEADFDESSLEPGRPIAKQPWLVRLAASDRWKGDLIVAGSPLLFHDDTIVRGANPNANQAFVRTLLRTFTSPERLARIRVPRNEPERVEPLSLGARLAWRIGTVFLVPVILLGLAVLGRRSRPAAARTSTPALRLAAGIGAFAVLATLAAFVETTVPARADLTEGTVNTSSESTTRRLAALRGDLQAELVASEAFRMPPALKRVESRVLASLRDLGIRASLVRPEDLGDAGRRSLTDAGIEPFDVRGVANDATAPARVWSALRLSHAGRTEIIPRLDARTVENLDFLLCAAFERLASGHTPVVAVLSDLPRLSPAEAHDYQTKGYAAPVGSDVYSDVKETLSEYGYRVTYVNPETEALPDAMDLLLWLQPRNPQRAYPRFTEYLASGGRAIVALQHYNVQQRQWRGTGFKTVYWPQPQFHRFNEYLELIGVRQLGEKRADKSGELPGEVLFDRQHSDLVLKTEVHRAAFGEPEEQQVSRPFLIRAAGAGLAADSPITARLSGLEFIWGSRFTIDQDKLSGAGLTSRTLATTSPRAWTYAWSGGNIPEESFTEPKDLLSGPQPLAILLEGRFPRVVVVKDDSGRETMAVAGPDSAPASASSRPFVSAPGKLLLVGCSEMFKNEHLRAVGYQHDQFLLNATAFLAYGPELAAVQARTYAPRVLAYQPEDVIRRWRAITLALPPALFLLIGLARRLGSGRTAPKPIPPPESSR